MSDRREEAVWSFLPVFLVRSTGFGASLLDPFRFPRTRAAWGELTATRAACTDLAAQLRGFLAGDAFRKYGWVHLCRRAINRLRPLPPAPSGEGWGWPPGAREQWSVALDRLAAAQEHYSQTLAEELRQGRLALRDLAAMPAFAEAVFLSSESSADGLARYLGDFDSERRNRRARARERMLAAYLQRFTGKNEATAFFGPTHAGCIAAEPESKRGALVVDESSPFIGRRHGLLSWWAAAELAAAMARDPEIQPYLRPRLHPLVSLDGGEAIGIETRETPLRLPRAVADLVAKADGTLTMEQLAAAAPQPAQAAELLRRLLARQVLVPAIDLPVVAMDGLGALADWLTTVPEVCPGRAAWAKRLECIREAVSATVAAPWPEKRDRARYVAEVFSAVTGQASERGAGALYADRYVYYEEAQGGRPVQLGSDLAAQWQEALAPIFDCAAVRAGLVRAAWQRESARLVRLGEDMPLTRFLTRLSEAPVEPNSDPDLIRFTQELHELLEDHRTAKSIDLPPDALRRFLADWSMPRGAVCSPDILVVPNPEAETDDELVIGEIHHGFTTWCDSLILIGPNRVQEMGDALARVAAQLCPPGALLADVCYPRYNKVFNLVVPGPVIERLAQSGQPRDLVLGLSDLFVHREGDGLSLWSRSHGCPVYLYPTNPNDPLVHIFGLPVVETVRLSLGKHTPAVKVGSVVWQRERWEETSTEVLTGAVNEADLYERVQLLRQQRGWPDEVYVRTDGERKPYYVDFRNLFFIEVLCAALSKATAFSVTAAVPSSAQWWLPGPTGRHSCELRLTAVRTAGIGGASAKTE